MINYLWFEEYDKKYGIFLVKCVFMCVLNFNVWFGGIIKNNFILEN